MRRKQKETLHQKISHHLVKHFHRHIHKVLHFANHLHYQLFNNLELIVITVVTLTSFGFANLTGLNQNLYRNNDSEVAQYLLAAIQNPINSLKQGNIISLWTMNMDVENSFTKWYCTYGAARISPEFFPFIDEETQQRTWWWNAVDRCKNASDTWYKIWSIPSQWALIVYNAWGRFGDLGHVGKVLHYDKTLQKIIVRDMARVSRGTMSDRREDLTTANVECYIYNSKTNVPDNIPTVNTWSTPVITTWTTTIQPVITPTVPTQPIPSTIHSAPTLPPVIVTPTPVLPITPTQPIAPVVTSPAVIVSPIIPAITPQTSVNNRIDLQFENLSDIAEHFMTQNNIIITVVSKSPLKLWEAATITLEIQDKTTDEKYSWLLPFKFSLISTNDSLQPDISNIQLINDWSVDISVLAQKIWTATIVISMDGTKIGEVSFEVQ